MQKFSKQEFLRLQKKLVTDEKIGEKFGVTRQAIFQIRRKLGIESCKTPKLERNQKIMELHAKGQTVNAIAEKVGLSVARVYVIIRTSKPARSAKKKKIVKTKK